MEDPLRSCIDLNSLADGKMPALTSACGRSLAEAAAVCLEDRDHKSGVSLQLTGIQKQKRDLNWSAVTDQQRRCYNDLQEATEKGAYGIAILVVKELTGLVVVERSKKGPGFDYWLGQSDDDDLFSNKARLEVSGILAGDDSDIKGRTKQKLEQIKPSAKLAPGYVAIVEFSKPTAHMEVGT
jgi:hypothetical protein